MGFLEFNVFKLIRPRRVKNTIFHLLKRQQLIVRYPARVGKVFSISLYAVI